MSLLKPKLSETIKGAMKGGDKELLQHARTLHAGIRKKEVDDRVDLDDAAIQKLALNASKQLEEGIVQFTAAGRMDLADKDKAELEFLKAYLPTFMSREELMPIIEASIAEAGATTQKDMGKVMKIVLPKVAGKADNQMVNALIKEKLPSA